MEILEKQPTNIERENLEILALGFDIPLKVMGFEEVKIEDYEEHNNSSKLRGDFNTKNLRVVYKIRQNDNKECLFDWNLYSGSLRLTKIRGRTGMGNFKTFEECIDYIAEQAPIMRQAIEKQKESAVA